MFDFNVRHIDDDITDAHLKVSPNIEYIVRFITGTHTGQLAPIVISGIITSGNATSQCTNWD